MGNWPTEPREAVKHLKALYCYHIDYKEWDAFADLFADDATMDVELSVSTRGRTGERMPQVVGRAAIREYMPTILGEADTVHQVHSPIIDIRSPFAATAIWAMEDIVKAPGYYMEGRGHYRESYRAEDGRWRIATLLLTRTWMKQDGVLGG